MKFPEPIDVSLTRGQCAELEPYFKFVAEQAVLKRPGMLVAQIHGDSRGGGARMKVMFIEHERALVLTLGPKKPGGIPG